MKYILFTLIFQVVALSVAAQSGNIHRAGVDINGRFTPPAGYARVTLANGSFGSFLRSLPLLPHGSRVHYFNGAVKTNTGVYEAVVNMDIGNRDLQQCADVIMHLRAEYLYKTGQSDKISFRFTNGFVAEHSKWKQGYRIAVSGNKTSWVKKQPAGDNSQLLKEYMDVVYTYCGTLSLSKELKKVPFADMRPGDVLIKGGSPGHAELVMDMAQDRSGNRVFLLAQSYMPAQQMQILTNPRNNALNPWYELKPGAIITPEWDFTSDQLMRFAD